MCRFDCHVPARRAVHAPAATLLGMKVRWTARGVRLRLTELEADQLLRGRGTDEALTWPGGGWRVQLAPADRTRVTGRAGELSVQLGPEDMKTLLHPLNEGVTVGADPQVRIEKDDLPPGLA